MNAIPLTTVSEPCETPVPLQLCAAAIAGSKIITGIATCWDRCYIRGKGPLEYLGGTELNLVRGLELEKGTQASSCWMRQRTALGIRPEVRTKRQRAVITALWANQMCCAGT